MFPKTNSSIFNIVIEPPNTCIILLKPAYSNRLIGLKLKHFKGRGYVYFVPGCPNVICQALYYWKTHNKFYEYIFFSEVLSSKKKINFPSIDEHEDVVDSIHKKNISNKTVYGSIEDSLSMHRTGSNETALVSDISRITNDENVIIAPGKGK